MIQLWSLPNILTQNKQIEVEGSLHKEDSAAELGCESGGVSARSVMPAAAQDLTMQFLRRRRHAEN